MGVGWNREQSASDLKLVSRLLHQFECARDGPAAASHTLPVAVLPLAHESILQEPIGHDHVIGWALVKPVK